MWWSALLLSSPDGPASPIDAAQQALAVWALQFTPRVAIADEAVFMEVEASVRLFGGQRALRERVRAEGRELGVNQIAWAPNSLAALALARAGIENGVRQPLDALLDTLPMETLSAVRPHRLTLAHVGCRTLGDVRRLPRGGTARRFDKRLLAALDQAYGRAPEVHQWVLLSECFAQRLELMSRVEQAPALLLGLAIPTDLLARAQQLGYRVEEVPYACGARFSGESKTGANVWDYLRRGWKYVVAVVKLAALRIRG